MAETKSNLSGGPDPQSTEALYGLRPAVVRAVSAALETGDGERVRRLIGPLHYSDVADLLERLRPEARRRVIEVMGDEFEPEVLTELDEAVREEIVEQLSAKEVAAAVAELDTDDAVELMEDLDKQVRQQVLDEIPAEERALLEEGLAYPEESAGRLMQRETVAVPSYWTVGETIDYMRETRDLPDDFYDIFIVDPGHRPVGTLALNRLLRTKRPVRVAELMRQDIERIPIDADQEDVAILFRQHDLVSAPVVDAGGRLVGMITVDDVVDVIDEEAEEDLMRLGGVPGDDLYRAAIATTQARFSWLGVNLITAIVASVVIGFFEATIDQIVALAVLMPIVASMGGNAGTQTMTVAVRALAMRELTESNALRFVGKELLVGSINGVLFAVLVAVVATLWFSDPRLGLVIGAAMITNLMVAGLAGTLIPLGLARRGIDPAIASGVLLTTVTDVIGFVAFLGLAALFLL